MLHKQKCNSCVTFLYEDFSILAVISFAHSGAPSIFMTGGDAVIEKARFMRGNPTFPVPMSLYVPPHPPTKPQPNHSYQLVSIVKRKKKEKWRWVAVLATIQPAFLIDPTECLSGSPQSNNCCILLQREMGSERPRWMFLLNHAECVTIGQDDKRTKRKSDAQMQRNNQGSYRYYMAVYVFWGGEIRPEIC